MRSKISQIVLLCLLVFTQVADAFACQSMSCMQKGDEIILESSAMDAHAGHNMMAMDAFDSQLGSDCQCCQNACDCAPSMITVAVILDTVSLKSRDLVMFKQPDLTPSIFSTILAMPQRPPKPIIS